MRCPLIVGFVYLSICTASTFPFGPCILISLSLLSWAELCIESPFIFLTVTISLATSQFAHLPYTWTYANRRQYKYFPYYSEQTGKYMQYLLYCIFISKMVSVGLSVILFSTQTMTHAPISAFKGISQTKGKPFFLKAHTIEIIFADQ